MLPVRDAEWLRKESEECLAQADEAISPFSRAQWLLFSDEWMDLADVAEASAAAISLGDRLGSAEFKTRADSIKHSGATPTFKVRSAH
jgi:hypothetical protein